MTGSSTLNLIDAALARRAGERSAPIVAHDLVRGVNRQRQIA
jgi:hypothetical protein